MSKLPAWSSPVVQPQPHIKAWKCKLIMFCNIYRSMKVMQPNGSCLGLRKAAELGYFPPVNLFPSFIYRNLREVISHRTIHILRQVRATQVYHTQYLPQNSMCSHILVGSADAGTFQAREPQWRAITTNSTAEGPTQALLCKPLASGRWPCVESGAGPTKESAPALSSSENFDSPFSTAYFLLACSQREYSLAREPPC